MKTASCSSLRHQAQRNLLRRILKQHAPRVRMASKFLLHAVRDLMQVEQELKEDFAYAIGDANHHLNEEATFEPRIDGERVVDFTDLKDFAKELIQVAEKAEQYQEIGEEDDNETENETGDTTTENDDETTPRDDE